jgi:hypothetical protein
MKIAKYITLLVLIASTIGRTLRKKSKSTATKRLETEEKVWIDVSESSNWTNGFLYPHKILDQNNEETKRGIIIKVTNLNPELSGYVTKSGNDYILPYRKVSTSFSYEMPWTAYNFIKFYSNNKVIRIKTNAIDNDEGIKMTSNYNTARNNRRSWVSTKVSEAQTLANSYSAKSSTLTAAKGGKTAIQNQITKQTSDITTATNTLNTLKSNLATAAKNREAKEKAIASLKQQLADLTTKINVNDEAGAELNTKNNELNSQVSKGQLDSSSFKTAMDNAKEDFEANIEDLKKQLTGQTTYVTLADSAKNSILGATPDLTAFKQQIDRIIS